MTGVDRLLHIESDVGLLTNRRMSLEIGVGLAALSGRRLSMPWSDPIGPAPGLGPARAGSTDPAPDPRPRLLDLWEVPVDVVPDDEWADAAAAAGAQGPRTLDWGTYTACVYLADADAVPHPGVVDFANGRTRFVRIPDVDDRELQVVGRPLAWYSYFFHATGPTRRRLLDAVGGVRLRAPYRELGARVAADLGTYNVAHVRRTDLVRGIRSYATVSPPGIAKGLAACLPTDEPLVIATEADPASSLFDPIRASFAEVRFLSDVVLGDHSDGFAALPFHEDNALGAVTQEVAARAHRFVGTIGSTFTGLIHRERCRRDPTEPFRYTVDYTPDGPVFGDGRYAEVHEGRYTWNRIGLRMSPDALAWFREWPEAVHSPDDAPDPVPGARATGGEPIHAVVCTDTDPAGDWQCELLEHTWAGAGQPGELVRLVGCPEGQPAPRHARARVITTAATNRHPRALDEYRGFNRLWSLQEWLDLEHPRGTVLILDGDFVFRAPVRTTVEPGEIVAQKWYDFADPDGRVGAFVSSGRPDAAPLPPLTWPLLIDTGDLAALLPRWIDLTAELRATTDLWESDMCALVGAVAESDLTVRYETLGAWMNWPEEFVEGAPIVHYCQPVTGRDGSRLWYKQTYRPWAPLGVDPDDAALDYCRDLLHLVDDFVRLRGPQR